MENLPFIPEEIRVHLGSPDTEAETVSLPFPDYIKNVASSEIYPTWPESALTANIYAQISFALNRVYTEYYPSRGYAFDITNDTGVDQSFINGRNIFLSVSDIVDGIFDRYISRRGFVEPLFAQYCNGTTTVCRGLSQWGSVELAEKDYTAIEILENYYGNDVEIVRNVPIKGIVGSAPIRALRLGAIGNQVYFVQLRLNRISVNYPSIPKIASPKGYFDIATEEAVREFQKIFYLEADGIVGKKTWYRIEYVYNSVKKLSDLDSEGLTPDEVQNKFPEELKEGDSGEYVVVVQYMLMLIGLYEPQIPLIEADGIFGAKTTEAVKAFQGLYGLEQNGIINDETYARMFDVYSGIVNSLPESLFVGSARPYPGFILSLGMENQWVKYMQEYLNEISEVMTEIPKLNANGVFDSATEEAVKIFQRAVGLEETGIVGTITWIKIAELYDAIEAGDYNVYGQYPGYTLGGEENNNEEK